MLISFLTWLRHTEQIPEPISYYSWNLEALRLKLGSSVQKKPKCTQHTKVDIYENSQHSKRWYETGWNKK